MKGWYARCWRTPSQPMRERFTDVHTLRVTGAPSIPMSDVNKAMDVSGLH